MSEITSFVCPASWKITTLGQICKETGGSIQTGPFGSQLHASDYVEDGIPSVMPKNISIEKILDDDIARVSVEDVNRLSKHKLQMGDIVYSRRGDVEKCVLVSEKEDGWLCGTGCIKVRIGPVGDISAKYIHAFLSHPEVRRWISQHAVGATMPNLNTSILSSVPVYLPPKELQSFIANSWFGFNQKLLVNAGINNTLENIAQAIFKSWFVDFEPTKVKIVAREALLAENLAVTAEQIATAEQQAAIQAIAGADHIIPTDQLQTIADLFPNQLVDSELGEIPEGWESSSLGCYFEVVMGQSPKGDTYNEDGDGIVFYQGRRDFGFRFPLPRVYTTDPKRIAEKGDTLISVRAPVGDKNMADERCCLGRGLAAIRHKSGFKSFTYSFISHFESELANSGSEGTVFNSINQNQLKNFPFVNPTSDLIRSFEEIISLLDSRISINSKQVRTLTELRDSLLPKLLTGDIALGNTSA